MPVFDTFKKRTERLASVKNDVLQYRFIPEKLRIQLKYILGRVLTFLSNPYDNAFTSMNEAIKEEFGRERVCEGAKGWYPKAQDEFNTFIDIEKDVLVYLSVVEIIFKWALAHAANQPGRSASDLIRGQIEEFNTRCRENSFGFSFEGEEMIRVDSTYVHSEVVKPALYLLSDGKYSGARDYFLKAHEHYRVGKFEEAINECGKSAEAVMKAICEKRGWAYSGSATFGELVKVCFNNKLIPDYWRGHFQNLEKLLTSGVPPVRNQITAHGSSEPETVPQPVASYIMHMTAASIVFLADAEKLNA